MKLPKILTQKTFGISNWMLGIGTLGVLYLLTQGFPGTNTSDTAPPPHCDTLQIKGPIAPPFTGAFYAIQGTPIFSTTYCCNNDRVFFSPDFQQKMCCSTNLVSSGGVSYCPSTAMDDSGRSVKPRFPTSSTTTSKPLGNTPVTGQYPNLPSMRSVVGKVSVA